jgi:hypothetical protein
MGFPYPFPPDQQPVLQQHYKQGNLVQSNSEKPDESAKDVDEDEEHVSLPRKKPGLRTSDVKRNGKRAKGSKKSASAQRNSSQQQNPSSHIDTNVNDMIADGDIVGRSEDL